MQALKETPPKEGATPSDASGLRHADGSQVLEIDQQVMPFLRPHVLMAALNIAPTMAALNPDVKHACHNQERILHAPGPTSPAADGSPCAPSSHLEILYKKDKVLGGGHAES